jgi:spore coat protein A
VPGRTLQQIGVDQGLLAAPVAVEHLHLAPAERADVVIDFTDCSSGQETLVQNDGQPMLQIRVSRAQTAPRDLAIVPTTPAGDSATHRRRRAPHAAAHARAG